ncbi:hypothetical protein CHGG_05382 [Chaetomium globosum CBS 148.51]|uniref:Fucose-specific lectin n=1 Tax=Chaetomium globosum (strain ATCC 6205 / CBS 148.51 / DSM 1962 / NBRC 6347 / NRRL 1970) TaxID=306901 RepID=Q2H7I3_CHAGB|nr:uncharacterized protein CHGG_05382 [Chaetomium globosum CBS 148.51]EAQ88763.1 hypothetical protein CHGG_05382 [Chaetomium globosum CBS 148.51]
MTQHYHSPEAQPGLEVMDQPDLEAVNNQQHASSYYDQSLPQVASSEYIYSAKEAATPHTYAYSVDPEHYPSPGSHPHSTLATPSTAAKSRKRLWLIIGGVIAVLVILGAVLGGVLGSRAASSSSANTSASQGDQDAGSNGGNNTGTGGDNSGSSGDADTADDPAPKNTTTTTPIRKGSGLAVTGWRKPDGSSDTYLFFQDQKDELQYVRCDKSLRTTDKESTCWAEPVKINSYAIAGSRLAASTIIWGDFYQPTVELFYTGVKSRLLGVSLNDQETPNVQEDSVNDMDIYTGLGSNLGAYWPWTLYQDGAGMLHHVRNRLGGTFRPTTSWDNNELDIFPAAYSRLAIAPTATDFSTIAVKPGYAVFYQDKTSSKLAVHITDLNHPNRSATFHPPWPTTLPDIPLPSQAPIAAFSVARAGDADRRVDTYVLYLGGGG